MKQLRLRDRRRRLGRVGAGQPAHRPTRPRRVLVLEAGRNDYILDPFIHMPAALPYPIGNRLYDWKYESEPEPHMGGRRVFHARGKVLGGSSSINGMIFQRGNPMDFERWAGDPGMAAVGLRPLPALLQADGDLPRRRPTPGAAAPARWCSSAGRRPRPLFGAFFESVQQAGYPLTDDVNGYRQEGFAKFDRNVHRGRRLSAARAYLHPVMHRKNLDVETLALVTGLRMEGNALHRRRLHPRRPAAPLGDGRRGDPVRRGVQQPAAAPARRHRRPRARSVRPGSRRGATCPAWGPTCRTTSRSTSSTPPPSRCRSRRGWPTTTSRGSAPSGSSAARGVGASNHFEAGGFIRSNDEVAWPNLMFHFLPIAIRYDGSKPAESEHGIHGYQVHIGPMYADTRGWVRIRSTDPLRAPRAAVQLPLDRDRPAGVDRDGPRGPQHPGAARRSRPSAAARSRPARRCRPTRRSSTGWPATPRPRCTRRARPRWAPTTRPWSTRRRCGCTAPRGCGSSTPRSSRTSPTATSTRR